MQTGWYKIADGTEGTTMSVTTDASEQSAHVTYRITSWHGTTAPEAPAVATGTSTTPNPPSLTPSWGALDTLWFACATTANSDRTFSVDPTSYVSGTTATTATGTAGAIIRVVRRELNAATDNPDTFTIDSSSGWDADTVAVRPAGAAAATGKYGLLLGVG